MARRRRGGAAAGAGGPAVVAVGPALGRAPQPPLPRGGLRCATGAALRFRRGLLPPRLVVAAELTLGATAHGGRGGTGARAVVGGGHAGDSEASSGWRPGGLRAEARPKQSRRTGFQARRGGAVGGGRRDGVAERSLGVRGAAGDARRQRRKAQPETRARLPSRVFEE